MFFWLKMCVSESLIAADTFSQKMQVILENYEHSPHFKAVCEFAEKWGWDCSEFTSERFKGHLLCVCVCVCVCVGLGWVVGEFQTWRKLFMSQCSKQFTDLFANFVAVLTSHITVVFGNAFGLLSNITTMLFSTVIFLYCLFYFVQVLAFTITISKAHFSITMTSGRKLPC